MPRLSVIVPFRGNDSALETTVLSVLENRTQDTEVLVVHDGSYSDPYDLAEEVVLVEARPAETVIGLLNEGIMAACSPVVNIVLDGVVVSEGWQRAALEELASDEELAAVAVVQRVAGSKQFGISEFALDDVASLRSEAGVLKEAGQACAGPQLACGFYRKSTLLALDGLRYQTIEAAQLEYAFALAELDLSTHCDMLTTVDRSGAVRSDSKEVLSEIAQVAVDYEVTSGGFVASIFHLLSGLPSGLSKARSWSRGIAQGQLDLQRRRIEAARLALEERRERSSASEGAAPIRKAA
ncbi:MAG: glycosyltransferase family A protein [Planctomycetota bacterium]|nr:glycosyltransferase family A protein [Planctomycetota bacterium]